MMPDRIGTIGNTQGVKASPRPETKKNPSTSGSAAAPRRDPRASPAPTARAAPGAVPSDEAMLAVWAPTGASALSGLRIGG